MLPNWTLTATYSDVERAYQDGRLTRDQWHAYRAIWRYSAPRFSDLVPWPPVRAILAYLDRRDRTVDAAEVIEWRYDAGTADYAIYRWPATFAD